ncbi:MAG: hypothetical protein L0211_03865, partial [Planctomycetaceae bacterium]|nr:hypothetical protein [Planctomycetaceae bacterium]
LGLVVLTGCDGGPAAGVVSGKVTVDGQTPAAGSSITFIPMDGHSSTAGDVIEDGQYSAEVPIGMSKVEIRVPRPAQRAAAPKAGPGSEGGGGLIEESLPARFNDATELTIDVKPGKNPKDWDLSTK